MACSNAFHVKWCSSNRISFDMTAVIYFRSYECVNPLKVRMLAVSCLVMLRSHYLMKCAVWVCH